MPSLEYKRSTGMEQNPGIYRLPFPAVNFKLFRTAILTLPFQARVNTRFTPTNDRKRSSDVGANLVFARATGKIRIAVFRRYQANNFDKPLLPRLYSFALEVGSPSTSLAPGCLIPICFFLLFITLLYELKVFRRCIFDVNSHLIQRLQLLFPFDPLDNPH